MNKLNQKELEYKLKELLRKVNSQIDRIPGYTTIIFRIMSCSLEQKIAFLELILNWLKRYPDMEIIDFELVKKDYYQQQSISAMNETKVPFPKKFKFKVRYKCVDCGKLVEEESFDLFPNNPWTYDMAGGGFNQMNNKLNLKNEPHLVCQKCYYRNYFEPDCPSELEDEPLENEIKIKKPHSSL